MKKTCKCCQCGKKFGPDKENTCKIESLKFCSEECLKVWLMETTEFLDEEDFDCEDDIDDVKVEE